MQHSKWLSSAMLVLASLVALQGAMMSVAGAADGTVSDVDRARAQGTTRDVFDAAERHRSEEKFRDLLERSQAQMQRAGPQTPFAGTELPAPAAPAAPVDLEALAQQFNVAKEDLETPKTPSFLVFVSFSMPETSIRKLIAESKKYQVPLLVRGFADGSLEKTKAIFANLIPEGDASTGMGLSIDPKSFSRFKVSRVPAFVMVREPAFILDACRRGDSACDDTAPEHDIVYGDVSIRYALELFANLDDQAQGIVAPILAQDGGEVP